VATVEWAAGLHFSDGSVAMYGFSYQGLLQLAVAARRPTALRAIAPMMCCSDPFEGWTYEGGCLRWPFVASWAAQLAAQEHASFPRQPDLEVLPISRALGPEPPPWFVEWLEHPEDDEYWQARRPDLLSIDVPAFSVVGWFDDFSSGTAGIIETLGAETVCGPWAHFPWGTRLGDIEFGPEVGPQVAHMALVSFFDRVLKGVGDPPPARVRYYSNGDGWKDAPSWPPPHDVLTFHPTSEGNANSRHGDGRLVADDVDPGAPDVIVAEPLVPYPAAPWPLASEAANEDRRDVLCYTSDRLTEALSIAGSPTLAVTTASDVDTHDLVASLVLVGLDGEPRALSTGAKRVRVLPGERTRMDIVLRPIAWTCPTGSRLRLDLSAARFPAFDRNPHTTEVPVAHATRDHCRVATIEVLEARLQLQISR
jgi:putative CocE/NonD family hydrolase